MSERGLFGSAISGPQAEVKLATLNGFNAELLMQSNLLLATAPVATEFEGVVLRLGLTKETYSSSSQLRIGCERTATAAMCRNRC
jgi:hypothetical protein